ncbi:MAG: hypothetical protein ACREMM_06020 [Gemmatimonadales bacterium]
MIRLSRPVIYALCLLVGSLLAVVAGVAHPDLPSDGAAQLDTIAHCEAWRAIHFAFLFGFALSLAGLVGLVGKHAGTPGEQAARAGLIVGVFAYAGWMVIVAFMAGAGWSLAQSYVTAQPGLAATHAVFVYDMLHPFALAAQRAAAFALGLSTYLFGWGLINGNVLPRWLGRGAIAAGIVGMALALVFPEDTKADQAAFVLPVLWQVVTGALLLRGRPASV